MLESRLEHTDMKIFMEMQIFIIIIFNNTKKTGFGASKLTANTHLLAEIQVLYFIQYLRARFCSDRNYYCSLFRILTILILFVFFTLDFVSNQSDRPTCTDTSSPNDAGLAEEQATGRTLAEHLSKQLQPRAHKGI